MATTLDDPILSQEQLMINRLVAIGALEPWTTDNPDNPCHGHISGIPWYNQETCTHIGTIDKWKREACGDPADPIHAHFCSNVDYWKKKEFVLADKPSNPKDIIGCTKVPLGLVPGTTMAYLAIGHLEGDLKYGRVNWREAGVRTTVYLDACLRHIEKFKDGEWDDPITKVPHLANALACLSIIIDAHHSGKLTDDRPKSAPAGEVIDKMSEVVVHLNALFKDKKPIDYFIDGPKERE